LPLAFLFPIDLIVLVLFAGVQGLGRDQTRREWAGLAVLLVHITIGGFVVLMLGALLTGATHYLERNMHPFFLLTPLWQVGLVEKRAATPRDGSNSDHGADQATRCVACHGS
jgi:hypothetical protein